MHTKNDVCIWELMRCRENYCTKLSEEIDITTESAMATAEHARTIRTIIIFLIPGPRSGAFGIFDTITKRRFNKRQYVQIRGLAIMAPMIRA